LPPSLHILTVNARRRPIVVEALWSLLLLVVVNVNNVESVDVARQESEEREADVDEEIRATACYDVDADGRDCEWGG
jgi:hypothetical protein